MNTQNRDDAIHFGVATLDERQTALRLLVSARFGDVDILDLWWDQLEEAASHGLLVARNANELVGAIWAQPIMPRIVALWPPTTTLTKQSESQTVRAGLLRELESYLVDSDIELARALLATDDALRETQFNSIGCRTITTIESMYWPAADSALTDLQDDLTFHTTEPGNLERLERVKSRTYDRSIDCPAIREVIGAERVLKSYAAAPNADSSLWFVVTQDDSEVGCLILADDEDGEQCELMYMGIVPEHRGRSMGAELVRYAQALALSRNRRRVTVAVDKANAPAVAIYKKAGFVPYTEQTLVGRIFHRSSCN